MRRIAVLFGAAVFALVWACNVISPLALVLLATRHSEVGPIRWCVAGLGAVLFLIFALVFVARHWSEYWPLGGFGRLRGSKAWTVAFLGGAVVFIFGHLLKIPAAAATSISMVGAVDGPTVIYTTLDTPAYTVRQIVPAFCMYVGGCLAALLFAIRLARRHR